MAMGSPASPRNVGAVQPPRAARLLHTRRTLSKPASSSYRRFLVLCSFLRHPRRAASSPRYHFVCLSRGGPSRRVASSCALPYSRTLFSHPRVRAYIDRMLGSSFFLSLSLSLSRIPLAPAMHAARLHPPCRAHLGCRSRRQNPSDYNVCFLRAAANRAR